MEGKVLGNRYELLEKIGGGGMAIVYKAKCRLLNRFVAVKILRQEFINDEEFVKRFVIEAQSAGSLSHPNIVSIYDVGKDDDIHYIVMEYVNGITLKDFIIQKGPLNWNEAVNISIQITSAIEHAHANGIVHRDIKPHNILMTNEGIAKVTDFGIARAVTASTITMAGSTIGSVHYFSPEQARGGYIDEKSDLYSIGIVLYEMVTGRLPFDGETPVAIALKHIQVEPEEPVAISGNIPLSVNYIIMKAIRKDLSKRYPSASAMLGDLYKVLRDPAADLSAEDARGDVDMPTRRVKAISPEDLAASEGDLAGGKQQIGNNGTNGHIGYGGIRRMPDEPVKPEDKASKGIASSDHNEPFSKKSDKTTLIMAIITSVAIISIFLVVTYRMIVSPGAAAQSAGVASEFVAKNYVGKDIKIVREELEKYGITTNEIRRSDEKYAKDIIFSQRIAVGSKLKSGASIDFEVSDGPSLIKIQDLRKTEYRTAEAALKDLKLITRIEEIFDDTIATGLVVKTDPKEGEMVKEGSVVTIYKSKGPDLKDVPVPNLIGMTRDEAMKAIANAGLKLGTTSPAGTSSTTAKVIKQDPVEKTVVKQESAVNLTFSAEGSTTRRSVTYRLALKDPQNYSATDKIKVRVEVTPSDTGKMEPTEITKTKGEFPIQIQIPVPINGTSKVKIFLNGSTTPYVEFEQS